jgi:hypothetical protein
MKQCTALNPALGTSFRGVSKNVPAKSGANQARKLTSADARAFFRGTRYSYEKRKIKIARRWLTFEKRL